MNNPLVNSKYNFGISKKRQTNPSWVITFADLMALLMGFFVVLLTASEIDKPKFTKVEQSLQQRFNPNYVIIEPVSPSIATIDPSIPSFIMPEQMHIENKMQEQAQAGVKLLKDNLKNYHLTILRDKDKIIIQIPQNKIFPPGGADLNEQFLPALAEIRQTLKNIPGLIIVSGYTDDTPINNSQFNSNWDLSATRASSVIEALQVYGEIPQSRFVLRGYGSNHPLVPNSSPQNKEKNRRIEIMVVQDKYTTKDDVTTNQDLPNVLPW